MDSSVTKTKEPLAQEVRVTNDELIVEFVDGRTVSVPISLRDQFLTERVNLHLALGGSFE